MNKYIAAFSDEQLAADIDNLRSKVEQSGKAVMDYNASCSILLMLMDERHRRIMGANAISE
jgi:hypothetical protein